VFQRAVRLIPQHLRERRTFDVKIACFLPTLSPC
jgi:hypothetical protein